jgi:hypothetical protein
MSAHSVEKGESVGLMNGVNGSVGRQFGEQHFSVPTHTPEPEPEPEKTPHVSVEHDLGGSGLGLGL